VERLLRYIYEVLRAHILENGTHVELRRFSAFSRATKTAYLSQYNGSIWKIEGSEAITAEPNGVDGVFFADDDIIDADPKSVHVDPDIGPHGMLLPRLLTMNFATTGLGGITPEQQRMALTVWLFCLAFPDIMPTKPILLVEGVRGSGKSASMKFIQLALMGQMHPMIMQKSKEDDFGVVLLRAPIALFDNMDNYIEWVPDAICAYTTSGVWTRRRLYSDDDSMTIRPHAFIAVSTRNPASFRRDDVADRCIIIRLERILEFIPEEQLKARILEERPKLLGEYIWYIGKIVDELRKDALGVRGETHRMADFALMARAIGRVMGWTDADVDGLMIALQDERDAFINEDDPLIELLEMWLSYKANSGIKNAGRIMTATQLHSELDTLAQAKNLTWRASARSLSQHLRAPHLEKLFLIDPVTVHGSKGFRIYRQTETPLEIVG